MKKTITVDLKEGELLAVVKECELPLILVDTAGEAQAVRNIKKAMLRQGRTHKVLRIIK